MRPGAGKAHGAACVTKVDVTGIVGKLQERLDLAACRPLSCRRRAS